MIAQWENERISLSALSAARAQLPALDKDFKRFSLADHVRPTRPEPAWEKMAQSFLNGTTRLMEIEEEGSSRTVNREWLEIINYNSPWQRSLDN